MRKPSPPPSFKCTRQYAPLRRLVVCALSLVIASVTLTGAARAERIINPIALFNGLDKITGRIVSFEVAINETIQFGSLQLTPRACYTRPTTETPNTTAFIEVDELSDDNRTERLFTGWVFAASPGLHGIEHPVYDIWLINCQGGNASPAKAAEDNRSNNKNNAIDNIDSATDSSTAVPNNSATGNDNAVKVGEIDPHAPPPPPPRPPFEQQEDMHLDIESLNAPLRNGQPIDLHFSPIDE